MTINVPTPKGAYDIVLERGALDHIGEYLPTDRKILVVSDSGVPEIYTRAVLDQCPRSSLYVFPQGEASKNITTLQGILGALLKASFSRSDAIVAVGGGVVGDIAGFAAACYMRGIDFYNIPTTVLAQVDSSIGGKTAIDFEGVKNIVGAFHYPAKVIIDPRCLATLNSRLINEGLAEAIKMAATCDAGLFKFIEASTELDKDIDDIIAGALKIKSEVVRQDPTEKGLRRVLNFGHTIGHAIESAWNGEKYHGECVAAGMGYFCGAEAGRRIRAVLEKYSLPVDDPFDEDTLMAYVCHDKKKKDGGISIVYVPEIGRFELQKLSFDDIRRRIREHKATESVEV